MEIFSEAKRAHERIARHIVRTPVSHSEYLSEITGANAYLKNEHVQHTGSFKLRGALNRILSLSEVERREGVIAASTGNHGMAVAHAARETGIGATVFVPEDASPLKIEAIRRLGAAIETIKGGCLDAELAAKRVSAEKGQTYISPYNDPMVVAGQGTIGLELHEQVQDLDIVFVSVGGGGLISGIAGVLKHLNPDIRIVGCWAENSPVMYECIRAGKIVEVQEKETVSDGTMGGIERDSVTFEPCSKLIDDYVLVSEREIIDAMRLIAEKECWMIEGSAGVAVASALKNKNNIPGMNVAIVLCGRNIELRAFMEIVGR